MRSKVQTISQLNAIRNQIKQIIPESTRDMDVFQTTDSVCCRAPNKFHHSLHHSTT